MTGEVRVRIDTSFVAPVVDYLTACSESNLKKLLKHPAAIKTYAHAVRFGNTRAGMESFWRDVFVGEGSQYSRLIENVYFCKEYISSHKREFVDAFNEVADYLPPKTPLKCTLYATVGYDIGIISDGDALINLGHRLFAEDRRELLFMSMHEIHHVGYTHYNPIFSLSDLKTTGDLSRAIRYSAQLEGMAVYAPLRRRIKNGGLSHSDYGVLLNPVECISRRNEFIRILSEVDAAPVRPLGGSDFDVLEIMSGRDKRLWYITGADMARSIDETLGREVLAQTVIDGPNGFFDTYNRAVSIN